MTSRPYPSFSALPPPRTDWLSEAIARLWDGFQARRATVADLALLAGVCALLAHYLTLISAWGQCAYELTWAFALVALYGVNRRRPAF